MLCRQATAAVMSNASLASFVPAWNASDWGTPVASLLPAVSGGDRSHEDLSG